MYNIFVIGYVLIVLVAISVLFWPPIQLTLKRYFLFVFLLYHGPAFFYYQFNMEWQASSSDFAALLGCALVFFGLGVAVAYKKAWPQLRWPKGEVLPIRLRTYLFWSILAVVASVALAELFGRGRILNITYYDQSSVLSGDYLKFRQQQGLEMRDLLDTMFVYLCKLGLGAFVALLALALAVQRRSKWLFILAGATAVLILLSRLSDLHKGPAVFFLLQVALLLMLMRYGNSKVVKNAVVGGLVALGLLVPIYLRLTSAHSVAEAIRLIFMRVTYVPNLALESLCEPYFSSVPHAWGMNIRLVHMLFGSGAYVPAHMDEYGGTANAIYAADAFIDFSWYGVAAYSFIIGIGLAQLDYFLFRQKDILRIAMFVGLLGPVHSLISTSLISCLGGIGLLPIVITGLALDAGWTWWGRSQTRIPLPKNLQMKAAAPYYKSRSQDSGNSL